jgi:hypothetical protein
MTQCSHITLRDGRTLAYAQYGAPDGRPIIHCHGTPSSRVEGDLLFSGNSAAEVGVRIVVPDRPGMGRSEFQAGRSILDWPETRNPRPRRTRFVRSARPPAATARRLFSDTERARGVGLLGSVAPLDTPANLTAMAPFSASWCASSMARPALLRAMLRLNLRAHERRKVPPNA